VEKPWRIELLGSSRARYGDGAWVQLAYQKPTALLAYLAYYPQHPHPRDAVIELLWPGSDLEAARHNLRGTLYALRRLLAAAGAGADELLIADRSTVALDPSRFTTDVAEFRAAVQAAARSDAAQQRAETLGHAVALYSGELLPGFSDTWVLTEREHLTAVCLDTIRQLVQVREERGDLEGALSAARQAVSLDPLREEAHYDVMRLSAATGQPAACLRQYEELERMLREHLDETPSAEARALAEELRRNARTLVVARRSLPQTPLPEPRSPVIPASSGPPLRGASLAPLSRRLPVQLTCFFGREEEITRLVELLTSPVTRLVTLTGPGGSGKTRLAIAVAGRLQEQFGKAVAFVPLADLSEARKIPDAIADGLGLPRSADREPLEQVVEHVGGQPWLLVLDNYEHLVEEGALLVRTLLEQAPALTCLATSRQSLGLSIEQEFALLPLPTPRRSDALEHLRDYASVQLFVDRARAAHAGFELTEANAAAMRELCDRLEGLPLALELAAARAAMLTPEQMLAQLEQRFAFLVSRQRDVPPRHRTLRAAIESSDQLLDPELRQFFARLSVFRGGWTLEAARSVCDKPGVLDALEQLRDASLIGVEEGSRGQARGGWMRYRMLETLREYAWERLSASGELAAVRDRHRDWYLRLGEQAAAVAYGPEQKGWLSRLESEFDNLRAALAWSQEQADADSTAAEAGLRLASALWWLWLRRGHLTEGLQWLEGALARGSGLPASVRAPAFLRAAHLAHGRGSRDRSDTFLEQARVEYEKVLTLARREGDRGEIAATLASLADVSSELHDLDAAWAFSTETRQLLQELGDPIGLSRTLEVMARVVLARGDLKAGRPLLEERLAICRELGDSDLLVHALGAMGHLERDEGDYARARALYEESLVMRRELGYLHALAQSLEDLAVLAGREQHPERAIRLLGAAEAFCETLGARPPVAIVAEYERTVAEGRAALGEAAFAAVWGQGRAMTLEGAILYALEPGNASQ
jgi:predicted ATPase/DNA-binding SARP family transcriptional activator